MQSNQEGTVEDQFMQDVKFDDLKVEEVESDLHIIGSTGLEDKLQENVAKCIQDFRAAGIKVWMLTGDKGLTAKQIGISCGLLPPEAGQAQRDKKINEIYDIVFNCLKHV